MSLFNTIVEDIMRHTDLMTAISEESRKLLKYAEDNQIEKIEATTGNRDRMINILEGYQHKIESNTRLLEDSELSATNVDILKSWLNDLNLWVEEYMAIDSQIVEALEAAKSKTSNEIAQVFTARNKHKGYNLSSVKK